MACDEHAVLAQVLFDWKQLLASGEIRRTHTPGLLVARALTDSKAFFEFDDGKTFRRVL